VQNDTKIATNQLQAAQQTCAPSHCHSPNTQTALSFQPGQYAGTQVMLCYKISHATPTASTVRQNIKHTREEITYHVKVALSRYHCCGGNTTQHSASVMELYVTVNYIKILLQKQ